MTMYSHNAIRH